MVVWWAFLAIDLSREAGYVLTTSGDQGWPGCHQEDSEIRSWVIDSSAIIDRYIALLAIVVQVAIRPNQCGESNHLPAFFSGQITAASQSWLTASPGILISMVLLWGNLLPALTVGSDVRSLGPLQDKNCRTEKTMTAFGICGPMGAFAFRRLGRSLLFLL